jgi:lysyl-tRNA synthetase class 2
MRRAPDIERIDAALKRAAHRALYGTQEERSGRFLPSKLRSESSRSGDRRVTVMPFVQSSMMTRIEYEEGTAELDLTFATGKTYRYFNVPLEIYVEFLDAESKGEFFNENIKDEFAYAEVRSRHNR